MVNIVVVVEEKRAQTTQLSSLTTLLFQKHAQNTRHHSANPDKITICGYQYKYSTISYSLHLSFKFLKHDLSMFSYFILWDLLFTLLYNFRSSTSPPIRTAAVAILATAVQGLSPVLTTNPYIFTLITTAALASQESASVNFSTSLSICNIYNNQNHINNSSRHSCLTLSSCPYSACLYFCSTRSRAVLTLQLALVLLLYP